MARVRLESVDRKGLSPAEQVRRRRFWVAAKIHKILEKLEYITSPDLLQKEDDRYNRLVHRRAAAIIIGRYYARLRGQATDTDALLDRANKMYANGATKEAVDAALTAELEARYSKVDLGFVVDGMDSIAHRAANEYLDDVPPGQPKPDLSTGLAAMSASLALRMAQARSTLASRNASSIAKIADPNRKETDDGDAEDLESLFGHNYRYSASTTAITEGARNESHPEYLLLLLIGGERRLRTMEDDRVCEVCVGDSAAGWIPSRDPYPSGAYSNPIHPRCRCYQDTRLVWPRLPF